MSDAIQDSDVVQVSRWVAPDVSGTPVAHELLSEDSIARLRQVAKDEGYAAGLKAGMTEGQARTKARLELFDTLTQHLSEPLDKLEPDALQCMVELSIQVSRALINRELSIDNSLVLDAVSSALKVIPGTDDKLRIVVNPLDHELVSSTYAEFGLDPNPVVVADAAIARGGAIVEVGSSLVDAQIDARLENLLNRLLNPVAAEDD